LHNFFQLKLFFFISFVFALAVAVVAYMVPWFGRIIAPMVSALRSLPTLVVLLMILIWTNAGVAPIIVAFLSLFPMLEAGIYAALRQTDKGLLEMSRIYNVSMRKRILQLYLPSAAPYVLREVGAALAFSLKVVISAEVMAATYNSLGGMMQDARLYLEMPRLFALVAITFIVGLILELTAGALAYLVERRVK
jgi:NitT/TauT family transport system permease protein